MKTKTYPQQFPLSLAHGRASAVPNRAAVCAKLQHIEDELSYFEDVLQQYQYVPFSRTLFEVNEDCLHRIDMLKREVKTLKGRYELLHTALSQLEEQDTYSNETGSRLSADLFAEALRCARDAKILKKEVKRYTDEMDARRVAPEKI